MAEGLNKAMLLGNLGADPELRVTQNSRAVLKFRIATTESYKDGEGERKEVTHWHNIVLWGPRAEGLSKILRKGSRVFVEGRIENRSYDDKDGVKRHISEVVATNLILSDGKSGGGGERPAANGGGERRSGASNGGASKGGGAKPRGPDFGDGDDVGTSDDIPF